MVSVSPSASVSMRDAVVGAAPQSSYPITLAVADEKDRRATFNIAKVAFRGVMEWRGHKQNVLHYEAKDADFANRGLVCVVATTDVGMVGYIFYQPQSRRAGEAYIKEMAVSPRVRRKGVGTFLLGYVVGEAKDNGRSTIKLYTTDDKKGYYAGFGFTAVLKKDYATSGYTTDDDTPDDDSVLMAGDVNTVAAAIATKLKL